MINVYISWKELVWLNQNPILMTEMSPHLVKVHRLQYLVMSKLTTESEEMIRG